VNNYNGIKYPPPIEFSPGRYRFDLGLEPADIEATITLALKVGLPITQTTRIAIPDTNPHEITFTLDALNPAQAFADQVQLDLSKTFYPFGQQAQAGAAFYFASQAAFSKPGAAVQIILSRVAAAQEPAANAAIASLQNLNDHGITNLKTFSLDHLVVWEY